MRVKGQVPGSDFKNKPWKPWKFEKCLAEGGRYYFVPKVSSVQKLFEAYWANVLNIAKENMLKRARSMTECEVFLLLFLVRRHKLNIFFIEFLKT